VRILDVRLKPGEKTPMHSHPNLVVYPLTGGTIKSTLTNGKTTTATIKAGHVVWHNAQTHTSENVGKTEIHALGIELKNNLCRYRTPANLQPWIPWRRALG
jgi:quercetin dioxygenase-like cupin family protein